MKCTCKIVPAIRELDRGIENTYMIKQCPLCKAAPEMRNMLGAIILARQNGILGEVISTEKLQALLAKTKEGV